MALFSCCVSFAQPELSQIEVINNELIKVVGQVKQSEDPMFSVISKIMSDYKNQLVNSRSISVGTYERLVKRYPRLSYAYEKHTTGGIGMPPVDYYLVSPRKMIMSELYGLQSYGETAGDIMTQDDLFLSAYKNIPPRVQQNLSRGVNRYYLRYFTKNIPMLLKESGLFVGVNLLSMTTLPICGAALGCVVGLVTSPWLGAGATKIGAYAGGVMQYLVTISEILGLDR